MLKMDRKNVYINHWWAAMLPTLRTTGIDKWNHKAIKKSKLNHVSCLQQTQQMTSSGARSS